MFHNNYSEMGFQPESKIYLAFLQKQTPLLNKLSSLIVQYIATYLCHTNLV